MNYMSESTNDMAQPCEDLCDICGCFEDCLIGSMIGSSITVSACENFVSPNEDISDEDFIQGNTDLPGAKYKIGDTLRIVEVFERNVSTEARRKLKGYEFEVGYIDQYSTGEFVYSTGDEAENDIEYVFYEDEVEFVDNKEIIDLQSIFRKYLNDSKEEALQKARETSNLWRIKGVVEDTAECSEADEEHSDDCHCYRLFRAYSELNEAKRKIKELENTKIIKALDADATLKYIEGHFGK